MSNIRGGCGCGAVCYEAEAILFMGNCHCRDCQQATGSAFFPSVRVSEQGFRLTKGDARWYLKIADSGNEIQRGFCGDCGSPLFLRLANKPEFRMLYASGLDDPSVYAPMREIYTDSVLPWATLDEDVPHFSGMPI